MDKLSIQVLDDGTIKVTTDTISEENHLSADRLLAFLAEKAGGAVEIASRHEGAHEHHEAHHHDHVHETPALTAIRRR